MNTENPYQSPTTIDSGSAELDPHSTSVLIQSKRGAMFGAKFVAITCLPCFAIAHFLNHSIELPYPEAPRPELGPLEIAKAVGEALFATALFALIGAILGAFLLAFIALTRKARVRMQSWKQPPT